MDKKIKVVAAYVRKSRDNNESLEGQLSSIIEFCEKFEWEYEVYKEEGSASSEDWNRPELQRMIKRIEKQHYDAVVVTEQSRITRADEFPKFRSVLVETNCLFITTQTNSVYDYTKPEDEFVSDIMSAVAKQEIAFAKLRLKRGTIQSAKKGHWLGKKSPVGYVYNKDEKILNPSEDAPIIQRMFELYLEGLSTKDIAFKFTNENVITSTGIIWTSSGVSRLLNTIVYAGHSLYGRTTQKKKNGKRITKQTSKDEQILVRNTHKAIVSQEMFNEVQQLKSKRNSRPIALKLAKHKFSGLIRCGICGAIHSFQTANGKKRINSCQTRHYQNNLFTKYNVCENKGAYLDDFELLFFTYLEQYIKEFEEHIELIKSKDKPEENSSEEKIKSFEFQLKKLDQDIKRIQQGWQLEIYTDEEAQSQIKGFKIQKENIEKELKRLSKEINNQSNDYHEDLLQKMKDFYSGYNLMPESKANEELKVFVDTIIYKKTDELNGEMKLKVIWKH